jgi:hypothetical protein
MDLLRQGDSADAIRMGFSYGGEWEGGADMRYLFVSSSSPGF